MALISEVKQGDTGATARGKINTALATVEVDTSMTGNGLAGNPLGVDLLNEDDMASDSTSKAATQASIKAYVDNAIGTRPVTRSYSVGKIPTGVHYLAGFYQAPTADANLTQASTTVTLGTANIAYGAHAFAVAGGAGATDGSDLVLTVSGTSITDAGVRTAADSQVIWADCTTATTDEYMETSKKWIGQVVYTLSSTGGATFNFDFNYGFSKYEDFANSDFTVQSFEAVGECNTSDSGFNVELLLQSSAGWTYAATGFAPGGTVICSMNTDYNTETDLSAGDFWAYKRTSLATPVNGDDSEGVVIRITQGANNSLEQADFHIGVDLAAGTIT